MMNDYSFKTARVKRRVRRRAHRPVIAGSGVERFVRYMDKKLTSQEVDQTLFELNEFRAATGIECVIQNTVESANSRMFED